VSPPADPVRQPSDAALETATEAASAAWNGGPRAAIRAAVEAAYRVDASRPLLDRGAVRAIFNAHNTGRHVPSTMEAVHGYRAVLTDAVMELARPVPTREQIEGEVRRVWNNQKFPDEITNDIVNALLALLNGAGS